MKITLKIWKGNPIWIIETITLSGKRKHQYFGTYKIKGKKK